MEINKENITEWLKSLQDSICKALELEDGLANAYEWYLEHKDEFNN